MSRNLLDIRTLEPQDIHDLLKLAQNFKTQIRAGQTLTQSPQRVVGLLFFEGSTRTRVSFEQAANYLGYRVSNFASGGSSMSKGETLKDTILTLKYERLDALVMRHRSSGAAHLAAQYFGGPVLNAGDGQHEHPTQALGDALTILEHKGRIEGLRVAIVGDVRHSRVARSNAWLLHKLGAEVRFIGPRALMPVNMSMLPGTAFFDLEAGIEGADAVICLRLQRERMQDGQISSVKEYTRLYQVTRSVLRIAAPQCLLMHPGPINRGVEVDDASADGDSSAIHDQIENGIYVRMAGLHWVFQEGSPQAKAKTTSIAAPKRSPKSARTVLKAAQGKAKK
ncbi:MAG TPA: aspartate carbamoyltransferase catalytic subunit [Fimbriimonadaceae bacterium]|nr:aspartate carbamoyltransferase catalytic subunit [Fimbriimonadaceae bacterium]HRJ31992.1 aspartate carbamoyltransferase catalytic subunit [Fimbriimonadaceae bacterium]